MEEVDGAPWKGRDGGLPPVARRAMAAPRSGW